MDPTKYLSEEELCLLEKQLKKYQGADTLCLEVLLATGARASELLNIEAKDLDESKSAVFIRGLKGSRDRLIPLPKALFLRLKSHAPEVGRVFPIRYLTLYRRWDKYRPFKKKLHSLRHTFAIELYKKSKDIKLVQKALGHKYLSNTLIYSDYVFTFDELSQHLVG